MGCDKNAQIERLMQRDDISKNAAMNKVDKQMDIDKKRDYVASISSNNVIIDNSSDVNATKKELQQFMQSFMQRGDVNANTWRQAIKPTKLSFILSTILCIGGYTFHKIVSFEFF